MMLAKCGGASEPVGAGRGRVLTPQDDGGGSAPARPSGNQGPGGFPDNVYALAAAVFRKARMEQEATCGEPGDGRRKDQHLPEVKDEEARRRAYKLAFDTLAYLELLNDIMIDSCFNLLQPLPDDQMSLVMVMLYDLQERKFLPRKRGNSEKDRQLVEVREVEICLYRSRTRLAASLARCRIKRGLRSLDDFLSEPVKRRKQRANALPLYAWVNRLKTSLRDVCSALERGGFSQVKSIGQLEGPTFCQDPHCPDLLAFRAHLEADLYAARLFGDHKLLVQDKCRSLALSCLRPLLTRSCHVLVAGYLSVSTVTQAAMLASSDSAQVRVCWPGRTPSQREELPDTLASTGCKNVKLVGESFLELDPSDPSVQKVQVILLMPLCSASAVSNPVELLLAEGQELDLLHDLSQETFSQLKLDTLAAGQMRDLTHAMKFPQVRAVLYSTCSTYREENEEVVERALRQGGGSKQRMFRLRPIALSQFSTLVAGKPRHPFLKVDPSKDSNGCFVALLTRELDPQEAAQEVLVRAAAKGLLPGIETNPSHQKERRRRSRKATGDHPLANLPKSTNNQQRKRHEARD